MWSEAPTAASLLDARVARGWRPLPSALAAGPTILGYAARLTTPS